MIILSKLADYGVIVATHLATQPERQINAHALAAETRLPRATVAKVLRSLAHAGVVGALRGAIGMTQCSIHEPACVRHDFCPTRPHWQRINLAIGQALSAVSLANMANPYGANPYGRPARELPLRPESTVNQQASDPIAS